MPTNRALRLNNVNQIFSHVASRKNHNRSSVSYRPGRTIATMSQSHKISYWSSIHEDIESNLKQVIQVKPPLSVFEPMHQLVFAAPRDTAPALCIAACELVGGQRDQAMAAASALQIMYASSFTHEHLPLSGRPSLIPNSKPVVHHTLNPNIELLLPDGMTPYGFELLAESDDPEQNNSERILRVIIEIARAIGSERMINGQYNELNGVEWTSDDHTCEKKEGGLHACGAACGAILGGGSEEEIEKLRRYGFYVGMIRGMTQRLKLSKGSVKVKELKNLTLKELEGFEESKIDAISSFVDVDLWV